MNVYVLTKKEEIIGVFLTEERALHEKERLDDPESMSMLDAMEITEHAVR